MLAILSMMPQAFAADEIPRGTLDVDRTLVRVGTRPQLKWNITYPATAPPVIVSLNGTITPQSDLKMRVRTLGVAFQSGSTLLPLQAGWSKNNSTWATFFTGKGPSVVPTDVLVDVSVKKNDLIKFRGRGASNSSGTSWYPYHQTGNTDPYVVVLKKGDTPPSYAPAYGQGKIAAFLDPYIDGSGKINIGTRDLIILWEASTASPGTTYFDMQDLVVLVTFE
jgi:hypothetical protein